MSGAADYSFLESGLPAFAQQADAYRCSTPVPTPPAQAPVESDWLYPWSPLGTTMVRAGPQQALVNWPQAQAQAERSSSTQSSLSESLLGAAAPRPGALQLPWLSPGGGKASGSPAHISQELPLEMDYPFPWTPPSFTPEKSSTFPGLAQAAAPQDAAAAAAAAEADWPFPWTPPTPRTLAAMQAGAGAVGGAVGGAEKPSSPSLSPPWHFSGTPPDFPEDSMPSFSKELSPRYFQSLGLRLPPPLVHQQLPVSAPKPPPLFEVLPARLRRQLKTNLPVVPLNWQPLRAQPPPYAFFAPPTPAHPTDPRGVPEPVFPGMVQATIQGPLVPPPALVRRNRPPPLPLPPMVPMTPDFPPVGMGATAFGGPYFTYASPYGFSRALPRPPPDEVKEVPLKPSDKAPKERRGADRHAMSIRVNDAAAAKDSKQVTMERVVGEIAFQLDRRILSTLFPDRVRLYGYNVRDIPEKIAEQGAGAHSDMTEEQRAGLAERYEALMSRLRPLGYDPAVHPSFTEHIVNTYGILRVRPESTGVEGDVYNDIEFLRNIVQNIVPEEKRAECLMLLNCLHLLSQEDGKPLFVW